MTKGLKRRIEFAFRNYKTNLKGAIDHVCDWAWNNTAIKYDLIRVQGCGSSSHEDALIENIEENYRTYAWCRVVEKTLEHYQFEHDKRSLIVYAFFDNLPLQKILYKIGIAEPTFFRWKDEILQVALLWAREYKLVWGNEE